MARAETVETVEGGTVRSDPFPPPQNNYLRFPCPPNTIASLLNAPHHLDTCHTIYVLFRLPYNNPRSQGEPHTQQFPPSLSGLWTQMGDGEAPPRDLSGEESDSDREDNHGTPSHHGPLPDLLPRSEHPHDDALDMDCRRVANQLKMIGDSFNETAFHRAHIAQQWQDLQEVCRGFMNFITQTFRTLYRLT